MAEYDNNNSKNRKTAFDLYWKPISYSNTRFEIARFSVHDKQSLYMAHLWFPVLFRCVTKRELKNWFNKFVQLCLFYSKPQWELLDSKGKYDKMMKNAFGKKINVFLIVVVLIILYMSVVDILRWCDYVLGVQLIFRIFYIFLEWMCCKAM